MRFVNLTSLLLLLLLYFVNGVIMNGYANQKENDEYLVTYKKWLTQTTDNSRAPFSLKSKEFNKLVLKASENIDTLLCLLIENPLPPCFIIETRWPSILAAWPNGLLADERSRLCYAFLLGVSAAKNSE